MACANAAGHTASRRPTAARGRFVAAQPHGCICRYEQAFTRVLSLSSLEMVEWLIAQLDSRVIMLARPLPVSQIVLISLIQQLGFQLTRHTTMKLTWLRDALVVLDASDPLIVQHKDMILHGLKQNLDALPPAMPSESWVANPLYRGICGLLMGFLQ